MIDNYSKDRIKYSISFKLIFYFILIFFLILIFFGIKYLISSINKPNNAMELYSKGKFSEALPGLVEKVKDNPKDANLQMALGRSYTATNNLNNALKHYEIAGKIGKNAEAYYNVAIIYQSQGNIDMAIKSLEESLKIRKDFSASLQLIAQLYEQKGEKNKAIVVYKKLLKIKPFGLDLTVIKKALKKLEKDE